MSNLRIQNISAKLFSIKLIRLIIKIEIRYFEMTNYYFLMQQLDQEDILY